MSSKKPSTEIPFDIAPRAPRFQNLNTLGYSIADPTPVAPPIGYQKPISMVDQMRNLIRSEMLARAVAAQGMETFEESEDFDVPDDDGVLDPHSPWENDFDPPAREIAEAVGDARQRPPMPAEGGGGGAAPAEQPKPASPAPAPEAPPAKPALP
ncbi:hypothetical protein [Apis mellifera associated microvirus 44]|nr:hypothetical protein [Apis mellifera associated microvirus 44]